MSAERRQDSYDARDAIDALADRVDTLAAIVRETTGSLAANRGDVALLDQRVQERFFEDNQRAATALSSMRGELVALRGFVAEAPKGSGVIAAASGPLLQESLTEFGARIETLAEVVRATAGRLSSEQSKTTSLAEALAEADRRAEARFAEIQRGLEIVSDQAARALAKPTASMDPGFEQRVTQHVEVLVERVDFLAGTASATAEKLAATDGELVRAEQRREELLARLDERSGQRLAHTDEAVRSMRSELEGLKSRLDVDPLLQERVEGLVDSVQALGDRVGTLSAIVGETAGRASGRDDEIAVLAGRLGDVGHYVDDVAHQLRREIDALAEATAQGSGPLADPAALEAQMTSFGTQLGRLEVVVAGMSGAAEDVGRDLGTEIDALADAVARGHVQLEARLEDISAEAASTAARGADEMGQALHTLAERLERLEQDRQAVASNATDAESAWAQERFALEARLDVIAATAVERQRPEVDQLVGELGGRLARMESERATVADLAAVAETWTSELAALEARVGEGLSALEARGTAQAGGEADSSFDDDLSESLAELTQRIAQIEHDRDAVRYELAETATSWASERASLQESFSELSAFAASTAARGAEEMGRALHTLAERLETLEHDRQAVASNATDAESAWAQERIALEARLDAIAAAIASERPQAPGVEDLVDELAGRLARMEGERETVADLAALAETWTSELSALEARVDEGLSAIEAHGAARVAGEGESGLDDGLLENLDELTGRIVQIERDRDAVRDELTRTATSWATERAALQERVSELAARIVTGPLQAAVDADGDPFAQAPQELDRLRIGVEGLRMRLAYHEKTVSDLAGSRGVIHRLDELSARLDQLAAIVAAGQTSAPVGPAGATRMQLPEFDTAGLLSRLDEAERLRNETREKMLEQMEKIASRMDWRLQALEAADVAVGARDS